MSRRRLLFDGEVYFDDEQRLEPRRHWRRGGFLYRSLLPARRRLDESAEECDAASNATANNNTNTSADDISYVVEVDYQLSNASGADYEEKVGDEIADASDDGSLSENYAAASNSSCGLNVSAIGTAAEAVLPPTFAPTTAEPSAVPTPTPTTSFAPTPSPSTPNPSSMPSPSPSPLPTAFNGTILANPLNAASGGGSGGGGSNALYIVAAIAMLGGLAVAV